MGSFLLDGCRFDNRPPAEERPPADLGFEEPDGADIRGVGFAQPTDIFGLDYDRLYR
jgi:hypothetical protein